MKTKAAFRPLTAILFACGCPWASKTNSWTRIVVTVILLIQITAMLQNIWIILERWKFVMSKIFWSYMMWLLDSAFGFYFIYIMRARRSSLKLMMSRLSCQLNADNVKVLKILALVGTAFSLLYTLDTSIPYIFYYFLQKANKMSLIKVFACMMSLKDYHLITGRTIFCFFIRMTTFANINMMRDMQSAAENHFEDMTPSKASWLLKKSLMTKEEVLSSFSGLPALWFLREFVFIVGAIMMNGNGQVVNYSFYYIMVFVISLLMSLASHVFLVCFIDYCNKQVRKHAEELDLALTSVNYKKWFPVLIEINEYKKYEFSACDLFDINKSVGLSFISSLITFTVLFQQLLSDLPADNV